MPQLLQVSEKITALEKPGRVFVDEALGDDKSAGLTDTPLKTVDAALGKIAVGQVVYKRLGNGQYYRACVKHANRVNYFKYRELDGGRGYALIGDTDSDILKTFINNRQPIPENVDEYLESL